MKMKSILLFSLGAVTAVGAFFIYNHIDNTIRVKGESCDHETVLHYDAFAPTLAKNGEMQHYACCYCHNAWQDQARTISIGNTVTNRSKIDIQYKTQHTEISKATVKNDDILNVVTSSPYVVGLDQTSWGSATQGKGSGDFKYYQIDGKKALRISTENVTANQLAMVDASNNGYSEFRFEKLLTGTVTATFEYKLYDLDYSKHGNEARIQAVWDGRDDVTLTNTLDLLPDNKWHTYSFSTSEKITIENLIFKFHHLDGELFVSNLQILSTGLAVPQIYQEGYKIKFDSITNADYYIVHDNNANSEIRIDDASKVNGVLTYTPEAAGFHDIYVTAHSNSGSYDPSTSNVIENLEVNPALFYDNMANEYYVTKDYFEKKAKWSINKHELYTYKDKFTLNSEGTYYQSYVDQSGAFTTDANARMRYNTYTEGSNLYRIIQEAKETGTNVIYVPHNDGILSGNQRLEDNQELKTIMDAAYANNLKVIVLANSVYGPSATGTDEATIRSEIHNFLNNNGASLIKHKAFYGFALKDEPRYLESNGVNSLLSTSWAAKAVIDYFKANYMSKGLAVEVPFFLCSFLQFTTASDALFCCEYNYKNYIETWLNITGLNYYSTNIYTYTAQTYGCDEVIDINYRIYMDLKNKYDGLKMHLTVTANNDIDNRQTCNEYDIFGSTLYAAALNNYGISRYTYFPAIWTYHWKNGIVNRDGSKTTNYSHVVEAQQQFEFIQNKLYGFEPVQLECSTSGAYGASKANTRTMTIDLSNGTNNYEMTVNYNSQASYNSQITKAIPVGTIYYLFGNDVASTRHISTGETVTLNNGQAVLITDEFESDRTYVMSHNEFASNFGSLSTSDSTGFTMNATGSSLQLTTTNSSPAFWLNKELYGVTAFEDYVNISDDFDIVFKAASGKTATFRIVVKDVSGAYNYYSFQAPTTTGDWQTLNIDDIGSDAVAVRFELQGTFVNTGSVVEFKEIRFNGIDEPYLLQESKYPATVINKLSQFSGFGSATSVNVNTNGQYDSDMTFTKSAYDSYIIKFRYSYAKRVDSVYFFVGCQAWKGFEFIILSNKRTQLDVYDGGGQFVKSSGQSFYEMSANTDHLIEFHIFRSPNMPGKVYLGLMVDGIFGNQMLIDEPSNCKNNVFALYDYGADAGAGTVLKDY